MSKETFYHSLIYSDVQLEDIFNEYPENDYPSLVDYVMERVRTNYAFPDGNPEENGNKPLIGEKPRERFSVFCRTLENGADYSKERLAVARNFLVNKTSEVLQG